MRNLTLNEITKEDQIVFFFIDAPQVTHKGLPGIASKKMNA
jgi:hypothetical protein